MIRPTCAVLVGLAVGSCGTDPDRHAVEVRDAWEFAPVTDPNRSLEGTLDLRTGAFHADLVSAGPPAQARLEGSIGAGPALTGNLTDPASGTGPGIFGTGSCTYTAAGQH